MDIEKELQLLKSKIAALEAALKDRNNIFGSSYSNTGSSSSDYLIKTRGKVKIQVGNKFIDLIKDGKINVDSKFIYKEKEVGSKNGIYVIGDGEDSKVILVIDGNQITLKGEVGTTYVSFLGEQETTADLKRTALKNIGFLYPTLEEALAAGFTSGIVYVEADSKLYLINQGKLSEFSLEVPNPYPNLFVIAKNDDKKGALVIKGSKEENSLKFDSMSIYSMAGESFIKSDGTTYINIGGTDKLLIGESEVVITDRAVSKKFQSVNANESTGFRLYVDSEASTLEVDNLIVRKKSNLDSTQSTTLYKEYWYKDNNIIIEASNGGVKRLGDDELPDDQKGLDTTKPVIALILYFSLQYQNTYLKGDLVYITSYTEEEETGEKKQIVIPCIVSDSYTDDVEETPNPVPKPATPDGELSDSTSTTSKTFNSSIEVLVNVSDLGEDVFDSYDWDAIVKTLKNQVIFLGAQETPEGILKRTNNSLDIIKASNYKEERDVKNVISRIGNIEELLKSGRDGLITGTGIYSDNACFKNALYSTDYNLPPGDHSTKFASTEWISTTVMPKGAIIMFNGTTIPDGWHICDGTDGTPNLIGRFIKAAATPGLTGGLTSILLSIANMPKHSHTFRGVYYRSDNANDRDVICTGSESDVITTSEVGEGKPLDWEPSYYSLVFIIKVS